MKALLLLIAACHCVGPRRRNPREAFSIRFEIESDIEKSLLQSAIASSAKKSGCSAELSSGLVFGGESPSDLLNTREFTDFKRTLEEKIYKGLLKSYYAKRYPGIHRPRSIKRSGWESRSKRHERVVSSLARRAQDKLIARHLLAKDMAAAFKKKFKAKAPVFNYVPFDASGAVPERAREYQRHLNALMDRMKALAAEEQASREGIRLCDGYMEYRLRSSIPQFLIVSIPCEEDFDTLAVRLNSEEEFKQEAVQCITGRIRGTNSFAVSLEIYTSPAPKSLSFEFRFISVSYDALSVDAVVEEFVSHIAKRSTECLTELDSGAVDAYSNRIRQAPFVTHFVRERDFGKKEAIWSTEGYGFILYGEQRIGEKRRGESTSDEPAEEARGPEDMQEEGELPTGSQGLDLVDASTEVFLEKFMAKHFSPGYVDLFVRDDTATLMSFD
jgi:hypothetical protein